MNIEEATNSLSHQSITLSIGIANLFAMPYEFYNHSQHGDARIFIPTIVTAALGLLYFNWAEKEKQEVPTEVTPENTSQIPN